MNTREWDVDYRRYVIQLRTMLAHPEGSNPWLQSRQVLDEIVEVYPGVWDYAEQLDCARQHSRSALIRKLSSNSLKDRCPIALYRILVELGRGTLGESQAMSEIDSVIS